MVLSFGVKPRFLMVLIFFENFEKFSSGEFYHLSKMSLQGTNVPGRLCSELCPGELNNEEMI